MSTVLTKRIPDLVNGDHLTADEFHLRYSQMPAVEKAELIEGVVYMGSPVSFSYHSEVDSNRATWLGMYRVEKPRLRGSSNGTVFFDNLNTFQPDQAMFIDPAIGGQV